MGERIRVDEMATTSTAVSTVSPQEEPVEHIAVLTLRPARKEPRKKVVWTEDTVDNEHMNKKKSKCCCIYEKPHKFGESDSEESDDECEHCFGHVEKKKQKQQEKQTEGSTVVIQEAPVETVEVILQPSHNSKPPDKDGHDTVDKAS